MTLIQTSPAISTCTNNYIPAFIRLNYSRDVSQSTTSDRDHTTTNYDCSPSFITRYFISSDILTSVCMYKAKWCTINCGVLVHKNLHYPFSFCKIICCWSSYCISSSIILTTLSSHTYLIQTSPAISTCTADYHPASNWILSVPIWHITHPTTSYCDHTHWPFPINNTHFWYESNITPPVSNYIPSVLISLLFQHHSSKNVSHPTISYCDHTPGPSCTSNIRYDSIKIAPEFTI